MAEAIRGYERHRGYGTTTTSTITLIWEDMALLLLWHEKYGTTTTSATTLILQDMALLLLHLLQLLCSTRKT